MYPAYGIDKAQKIDKKNVVAADYISFTVGIVPLYSYIFLQVRCFIVLWHGRETNITPDATIYSYFHTMKRLTVVTGAPNFLSVIL